MIQITRRLFAGLDPVGVEPAQVHAHRRHDRLLTSPSKSMTTAACPIRNGNPQHEYEPGCDSGHERMDPILIDWSLSAPAVNPNVSPDPGDENESRAPRD